jgi:glucose-6-phosphate isomerase
MPGNRPSNTILIDKLTPRSLGALIATYEHKVFALSVLWDINPFDQWGVELGKQLCNEIASSLSDNMPCSQFDESTRQLVGYYHRKKTSD